MAARGKAVRSAVSSGRHEMTKGMRKTRSIGQDIEWWWKGNAVQIPGTKNALYRAFLDSLALLSIGSTSGQSIQSICRGAANDSWAYCLCCSSTLSSSVETTAYSQERYVSEGNSARIS